MGGHVILTVRIDVDDPDAFVEAGRRSVDRDDQWLVGQPTPASTDREVIDSPEQAAADLLVEAWVRCYGSDSPRGARPLIDQVDGAWFGDIDDKTYYPDDREEVA